MKKITRATFKSFITKNMDNLVIDVRSSFDGMIDGLNWNKDHSFKKVEATTDHASHTLGVKGVWLVGNSRDYFQAYNDGEFSGIAVSNCCGYFTIVTPKLRRKG